MSYELFMWYICLPPWEAAGVRFGVVGTVFAFFWCLRLDRP